MVEVLVVVVVVVEVLVLVVEVLVLDLIGLLVLLLPHLQHSSVTSGLPPRLHARLPLEPPRLRPRPSRSASGCLSTRMPW